MNPEFQAINQPSDRFYVESELTRRSEFSRREVGLNHPDTPAFIKLNDDGDIEIFAAPGIGIVISAVGNSISLFADNIRMFSKEEGLRWNNYNFNYSAVDYSEPTLVKIDYKSIHSPQNHAQYYLSKLEEISEKDKEKAITIQGEKGFGVQQPRVDSNYSSQISLDGLNQEQITLVENVLKEYPKDYVIKIIDLLKQGYSFSQAQEKVKEF